MEREGACVQIWSSRCSLFARLLLPVYRLPASPAWQCCTAVSSWAASATRLQVLLARRGIFRSPSFQLEVVCISVTHRVTLPAPARSRRPLHRAGTGWGWLGMGGQWDFLGLAGTCCPGWAKAKVDRTRRLRVFWTFGNVILCMAMPCLGAWSLSCATRPIPLPAWPGSAWGTEPCHAIPGRAVSTPGD